MTSDFYKLKCEVVKCDMTIAFVTAAPIRCSYFVEEP